MPGVPQRIDGLRLKFSQLASSVAHYEQKVASQERELEKMHRGDGWNETDDFEEDGDKPSATEPDENLEITDDDLRKEEEEIRELERIKKELEERVSGMERDLGGLLR